ncbi:MAG: single-stranded-DNA-specific exonuclease RecJ [Patescibacteria group bacterium]
MFSIALPEKAPQEVSEQFPEYSEILVQLLFNRGLRTAHEVELFLNPEYHHLHDPYLFRHMQRACERIYRAIQSHELIAVHGDYDADGVSGTVIIESVLKALGARTMAYLPHREKEGYGLNTNTVNFFNDQGARLIITCDCGISNSEEILRATSHGIDTIITDHHQIPPSIPEAYAIIHPKIPDEPYPFKFLAGGGVAFKLGQALLRHSACQLSPIEKERTEKWLLDLTAISTVADMVELIGENRVLTHYGLLVLSKNRRLGLRHLYSLAGIDEKKISTHTIGFQIAPRINAAGRMDHANTAYKLLTAESDAEGHEFATLLESQNRSRQKKTEEIFREALDLAEGLEGSPVIVLYQKHWLAGITGLVASKISKHFGKPAFILAFDGKRIVGSGRSPEGINILRPVHDIRERLISYGGHLQACGFKFSEEAYEEVAGLLKNSFRSLDAERGESRGVPVDAAIRLSDISWELVDWLQKFEPYGQVNPEPLFFTENVEVVAARRVGSSLAHLKLALRSMSKTLPAIAFSTATSVQAGDFLDILYHVRTNEWNGNREIQLNITQLNVHE